MFINVGLWRLKSISALKGLNMVVIPGGELLTFQQAQNICDVGTTLYKCYTNVLCLLGLGGDSLRVCDLPHALKGGGPRVVVSTAAFHARDDWDDTVLRTQNSKFAPWRSEAEHATSRSRRLPTILTFTRGWGRNIFVSFKPPRPGTEPRTLAWKAAVLTTTLGPPPWCFYKI